MEVHDKIETIKCDKSGSNEGDERKKEKALNTQESREIVTIFLRIKTRQKMGNMR